jgi:putative hydrolase of the HAD superfamily
MVINMRKITAIGFDADDTLWENEQFFRITQQRFAELLADFADPEHLDERLLRAERRNLGHYGFGIKGFVLSMIETAIEVTDERVSASIISQIIAHGQEMLAHPIELLPHARETIETLAIDHRIILITKGDLLDQERKLAQSGLGDLFDGVEIVSNKTARAYADIFARHGDGASRSLMAGNSMKSDVLPAIQSGAWGVYVPHELKWDIEHADPPKDEQRYHMLDDLGGLPDLVQSLQNAP